MNYRVLNKLTSLYFVAVMAIGVIYLALIWWVFAKTISGTAMFLIYFLDSKRYGYDLASIGDMPWLWASLGLWLLSLVWLWKALVAGIKTVRKIMSTEKYVNGLKLLSRTGNKVRFDSASGEIFTAGMLHPTIYLVSGLNKTHSNREIQAMIAHEENHVRMKDPLRTTLVMMVGKSMPNFPMKEKMFRYFITLTELCADKSAEESLADGLPLITALYKKLKMSNRSFSAGINYFNSQSERIGILVGKKKLNWGVNLGLMSGVMAGLLVFAYVITKSNFYNCPHLSLCLSALTSVLEIH